MLHIDSNPVELPRVDQDISEMLPHVVATSRGDILCRVLHIRMT